MIELPDTFTVEVQLLRYLAASHAPRSAKEAYDTVGDQLGISRAMRSRSMPNQGESHWANRVRTAMSNLVKKGYAERSVRDEWIATKNGRDRVNFIDSIEINI